MKNITSEFIIDPNTFESVCCSHGYWIVKDGDGAIGIMHGIVRAAAPAKIASGEWGYGTWINIDGIVFVITEKDTYYLKPAPLAEYETAKAFGYGTEYDPEQLPDLVKLPDEIPLDNS